MKKTLFSLSALFALSAGIVQADTSLRYHYDFEKISGTGSGTAAAINHNLSDAPGTGSWTKTDGWLGWTNYGALGSNWAYNHPSGGASINLTGQGPNNSLGVNTSTGFTFSFFIRDNGTPIYQQMFQINSSSGQNINAFKVTGDASNAGLWEFRSGTTNIGNWASTEIPTNTFANIVLTFQNGTLAGYKNGTRFITATGVNLTGDITSITLGNPGSVAAYDEVALYSGVLNQEEITYLASHPAKDFTVPEPATATLGLAGLALLALRRRRRAA